MTLNREERRELVRIISIILVPTCFITLFVLFAFKLWRDAKYESYLRVQQEERINGTDWVAQIRCFLDDYQNCRGVDIRLVNSRTLEKLTLVEGSDVQMATLRTLGTGSLNIQLLTTSGEIIHLERVPLGVHVKILTILRPPVDRDRYLDWYFQPRDEANRLWFCEHALPYPPDNDKEILDQSFAIKAYGQNSTISRYCIN